MDFFDLINTSSNLTTLMHKMADANLERLDEQRAEGPVEGGCLVTKKDLIAVRKAAQQAQRKREREAKIAQRAKEKAQRAAAAEARRRRRAHKKSSDSQAVSESGSVAEKVNSGLNPPLLATVARLGAVGNGAAEPHTRQDAFQEPFAAAHSKYRGEAAVSNSKHITCAHTAVPSPFLPTLHSR